MAAHQQVTDEWWRTKRQDFELFASQLVMREAQAGNEKMARKRMDALKEISVLEITEEAIALSGILINNGPLPEKAAEDAVHIATAVVNGIDYLITWNCKHIANAKMREEIEQICRASGYESTVICSKRD